MLLWHVLVRLGKVIHTQRSLFSIDSLGFISLLLGTLNVQLGLVAISLVFKCLALVHQPGKVTRIKSRLSVQEDVVKQSVR